MTVLSRWNNADNDLLPEFLFCEKNKPNFSKPLLVKFFVICSWKLLNYQSTNTSNQTSSYFLPSCLRKKCLISCPRLISWPLFLNSSLCSPLKIQTFFFLNTDLLLSHGSLTSPFPLDTTLPYKQAQVSSTLKNTASHYRKSSNHKGRKREKKEQGNYKIATKQLIKWQ